MYQLSCNVRWMWFALVLYFLGLPEWVHRRRMFGRNRKGNDWIFQGMCEWSSEEDFSIGSPSCRATEICVQITEGLQSTAALQHYQHSTTNGAMIVRNAEQLPATDMKLHPSLFISILCLEMSSAKMPFFPSASFLNAVLVTKSSF